MIAKKAVEKYLFHSKSFKNLKQARKIRILGSVSLLIAATEILTPIFEALNLIEVQ